MIKRIELTREQALHAVSSGEFPDGVVKSKDSVVVIMTQHWCPQWKDLKSWVYELETDKDVDVYELVYNRTDFYNEFMGFKESTWNNHEIPYLRFYKKGKLAAESNYLRPRDFLKNVG